MFKCFPFLVMFYGIFTKRTTIGKPSTKGSCQKLKTDGMVKKRKYGGGGVLTNPQKTVFFIGFVGGSHPTYIFQQKKRTIESQITEKD